MDNENTKGSLSDLIRSSGENIVALSSSERILSDAKSKIYEDLSKYNVAQNFINIEPTPLPVIKNTTVEELQKMNQQLKINNEQLLSEIKRTNDINSDLHNTVSLLSTDLEKERIAKNKAERKAKIYQHIIEAITIILTIIGIIIGALSLI